MKQAISYIRISDKDQSNFSLSGQQDYINAYCERKGIALINSFIDNGQSAKNFDRADWRNLEAFVKNNHRQIDHLVVVKYDRFSRDLLKGLEMIETLEKKYKITILSVFEDIAISTASPFFFKMRTDMLVQAEFELRVIRDRTVFGINQAKKEGRWINRAPFGYKNIRDHENRPALEIVEDKADIVRKAFKLRIEGAAVEVIRKELKDYKVKGSSAVTKLLTNPTYAGLIPYNGDYVKARHSPIIDIETFSQVQHTFKSQPKSILNDEVPLRGTLRCFCGHPLTAGRSKGKSSYYWYYKCENHLRINISAKVIHTRMLDLMHGLSLPDQTLELLKKDSEAKLKKALSEQKDKAPAVKAKIKEVETRLQNLEEKFILNQVNFETYSKWHSSYAQELNALREKLTNKNEASIWEAYRSELGKLTDLGAVYENFSTIKKQSLINIVFNRTLKYQLNTFLSEYIMDIFASQATLLKEKGLLIISNPLSKFDQTPLSTRKGSIVELLEVLKSA